MFKHFWLIITDGIDCSGKSTFIKEFNKTTNYSTWIIDRSTVSVRAYAKKFNRNIPNPFNLEYIISTYPYHLFIRFIASKEDTIERQNLKNDGYDSSDYDKDMKLFSEAQQETPFRQIILNSSDKTTSEEVQTVIDRIKEIDENNG